MISTSFRWSKKIKKYRIRLVAPFLLSNPKKSTKGNIFSRRMRRSSINHGEEGPSSHDELMIEEFMENGGFLPAKGSKSEASKPSKLEIELYFSTNGDKARITDIEQVCKIH